MALFSGPPKPVASGIRLELELYHASHQNRWVQVRSSSRDFIAKWEPKWDERSATPAAFQSRLKFLQDEWRNKTGAGLLLILKDHPDRPVVGGISLTNIRYNVNMSTSVGYWIGQNHARKGYMFEGLNLALDWCFSTLRLRRIEAATLLNNIPSQNLLRKLGFQEEGIARQLLCIDDKWQNHIRFALLRDDPRFYHA